jgi:hypothetical protein
MEVYSSQNFMDSTNLGIVIGPSIMRPSTITASQTEGKIAAFFIEHYDDVLGDMYLDMSFGEAAPLFEDIPRRASRMGIIRSKKDDKRLKKKEISFSGPVLVSTSNHALIGMKPIHFYDCFSMN